MTTHYDTLGVDKSATKEEIKIAYRRKAKTHHPDREHGDEKKMLAVQMAYNTLSDSERRERYDRTGEDGPEQSLESQAAAMLAGLFSSYLDGGSEDENALATIRQELDKVKTKLNKHIADMKAGIAKVEKRRSLVKRKAAGIDLYEGVLNQKIQTLNKNIAVNEHQQKLIDAVLVLVDEYECHVIERPTLDPYSNFRSTLIKERDKIERDIMRGWRGT